MIARRVKAPRRSCSRRKASVKIRRNPPRHLFDQVQIASLIIQNNGHTDKKIKPFLSYLTYFIGLSQCERGYDLFVTTAVSDCTKLWDARY